MCTNTPTEKAASKYSDNHLYHKMVICPVCLEITRKVYGNGLAMLGSLVMSTVYTNEFIIGKLKLRLDH